MLRPVPAVGAGMAHITINQYLQQVTLVPLRRARSAGSSPFCFGLSDLGMRWAAALCLAGVRLDTAGPPESVR